AGRPARPRRQPSAARPGGRAGESAARPCDCRTRRVSVALPPTRLRVVLTDVDGVITPGEGEPIDLEVIARLADVNARAQRDPLVPALALCTGRQAPYVELMAKLIGCVLPCIFEHGAGLLFPTEYRYE